MLNDDITDIQKKSRIKKEIIWKEERQKTETGRNYG